MPDESINSADILEWGMDGKIHIQEDRSTSPSDLFETIPGEQH